MKTTFWKNAGRRVDQKLTCASPVLTRQLASPRPVASSTSSCSRNSWVKSTPTDTGSGSTTGVGKLPSTMTSRLLQAAKARRQSSAKALLALRPKVVESNKRSTIPMSQFSHECSKSNARILQFRWAYELYGEPDRMDAHATLSRSCLSIELIYC